MRGKRRSVRARPCSWRRRSSRSAASSRSSSVNAGSRPTSGACWRRRRLAIAWNVPAHGSAASAAGVVARRGRPPAATMRSARRVISCAARRENVSSRIRRGSAPRAISAATRCASVCVFPVPAPAMIRSGRSSASAARRCAGLSSMRPAYTNVQVPPNSFRLLDLERREVEPASRALRIRRRTAEAPGARLGHGDRVLGIARLSLRARRDDRVIGRRGNWAGNLFSFEIERLVCDLDLRRESARAWSSACCSRARSRC